MEITIILEDSNQTETFDYPTIKYTDLSNLREIIKSVKTKHFIILGANKLNQPIEIELTNPITYFEYNFLPHSLENLKQYLSPVIGAQYAIVETRYALKCLKVDSLIQLSYVMNELEFKTVNYKLFDINTFTILKEDAEELKRVRSNIVGKNIQDDILVNNFFDSYLIGGDDND